MRIDQHGGNPSATDLGAKPNRPVEVLKPRGAMASAHNHGEIKQNPVFVGDLLPVKKTSLPWERSSTAELRWLKRGSPAKLP